ncbi:MAG: sigma-54-dependent Fis family transcriptional regulator, partial [Planctomycetota bacterium]
GFDLRALIEELLAHGENGIHEKVSLAVERVLLPLVLQHTHGHQSQASEILGLNRATLRHKLRSLGLSVDKTVTEEDAERD